MLALNGLNVSVTKGLAELIVATLTVVVPDTAASVTPALLFTGSHHVSMYEPKGGSTSFVFPCAYAVSYTHLTLPTNREV